MKHSDYSDPYHTFNLWLREHQDTSGSKHLSACALSTIGLDGYPNTRFVALKEVKRPYFIITGSIHSRKGKEIEANHKVALTFWWEENGRQIRIQGVASLIDRETATYHFANRSKIAQLASLVSRQGETLDSLDQLENAVTQYAEELGDTPVACPLDWGGYQLLPKRIEFMKFKANRLHERMLYTLDETNTWFVKRLQP